MNWLIASQASPQSVTRIINVRIGIELTSKNRPGARAPGPLRFPYRDERSGMTECLVARPSLLSPTVTLRSIPIPGSRYRLRRS
jgi:hypothetical protein